jgi:hypothetical protein
MQVGTGSDHILELIDLRIIRFEIVRKAQFKIGVKTKISQSPDRGS